MEKQIIQQKNGNLLYSDGTRETIKEYRDRLKIKPKDHSKKYTPEDQAERDRIIKEIYNYDRSCGMHYDREKGFLRNEDGGYYTSIEAAGKTFSGASLGELRRIERAMISSRKGDSHE